VIADIDRTAACVNTVVLSLTISHISQQGIGCKVDKGEDQKERDYT